MPEVLERTATLVVDNVDGALMLCIDDGKASKPLALFVSTLAARQFSQALTAAKQSAHAAGRSGI